MGAKFGKRSLKYDGWYYRFVEFGTVFQSAQPFLQPAWDATKGMANQIMATEFDGIFNKFKQKYKL
jgi:HK97 gp10 family phage protein